MQPVQWKDIRVLAGRQVHVRDSSVNLTYVSDLAKMKGDAEDRQFHAGPHASFIDQNVCLYFTSEGLETVLPLRASDHAIQRWAPPMAPGMLQL